MKKTSNSKNSLRAAAVFGLALFGSSLAQAQPIEMSVGNIDWNDSMWGDPAAPPISGNDYISKELDPGAGEFVDGNRFRIGADFDDTTFLGDSITVVSGTTAFLKVGSSAAGNTNTATINGNLFLNGGTVRHGPEDTFSATFAATEFVVNSASSIMAAGKSTGLTLDGILTGVGNLTLLTEQNDNRNITFNNISGFTGGVDVADSLIAEFGTDYAFSSFFNLVEADSRLRLGSGRTLTFNEGELSDFNNGTVAPGTYSGASLDALGGNYVNDGGTLVVIPEPATGVLLMVALGTLFAFRRKMR